VGYLSQKARMVFTDGVGTKILFCELQNKMKPRKFFAMDVRDLSTVENRSIDI
jgi:hypothetical protein